MRDGAAAWARIALAVTTAVLAATAFLLLWTTLMVHDDEGYVLYSLQAFADHGHLYETVYTQYGPFFYLLFGALHQLGLAFTSTTAREMAFFYWVGSAAICGQLVWRLTRGGFAAALGTLVGIFAHLWAMTAEPSHPGGFAAFLTACAAWCGTQRDWSARRQGAALGAIGAMLVLTKINVGVLYFAALTGWYVLRDEELRRRGARWLSALVLAVLPAALMHTSLALPWVRTFVVVAACAAVALVAGFDRAPSAPRVGWVSAAVGALVVSVATVVAILATGTSWGALIEGILLGPLRHPSVYSFGFNWRSGTLLIAIASVPLAIWLGTRPRRARAVIVVPARILAAAIYAACATGQFSLGPPGFGLSFGVTTAWIFVIPVRDDDETFSARAWLGLLVVLQSMHAYPVAGSQVSWGTFLWVPLAALGVADLHPMIEWRWLRRTTVVTFVAVALFVGGSYARVGAQRFAESDPFSLPGAESLRPMSSLATADRMLVRNAQVHGDRLFSYPGMLSFNAWSGLPPPTIANATHWFSLLSGAQQDEIQHQLEADPRAVVIAQKYLIEFLAEEHRGSETPLVRWLRANYHSLFRVESYEFWVRNERRVVPVNAARLFTNATGRPTTYIVNTVIAPRGPVDIARIELSDLNEFGHARRWEWTAANARIVLTPVDEEGNAAGPTRLVTLPFRAEGLCRIEVFTDTFPRGFDSARGLWRAHAAAGGIVAEARFVE